MLSLNSFPEWNGSFETQEILLRSNRENWEYPQFDKLNS